MALATDYITAKAGIAERVSGWIGDLGHTLAQRRKFSRTVREMNMLSDRELADLGLVRSEITRLAYQATYGG